MSFLRSLAALGAMAVQSPSASVSLTQRDGAGDDVDMPIHSHLPVSAPRSRHHFYASNHSCYLSCLPMELLENILCLYLPSSVSMAVLPSLSRSFASLMTSDSICKRLLVLLHSSLSLSQSLSEPSPLPLAAFIDLTQWEDVSNCYALYRSLSKYCHLLGHWRSHSCYLGQMLCFALDMRARSIYGMMIDISDSQSSKAVIEIDLNETRPSEAFYLEWKQSTSNNTTCIRHPCAINFHRSASGNSSGSASIIDRAFTTSTLKTSTVNESGTQYQSFSLHCPTLPNASYLALGVQHLPTPLQRRQPALFYPNPPALMTRLHITHAQSVPAAPYPSPGLYVGQYGPHGPELMYVEYNAANHEMIATKVLGDANVPAGKISFRISLPSSAFTTNSGHSNSPRLTNTRRCSESSRSPSESDDVEMNDLTRSHVTSRSYHASSTSLVSPEGSSLSSPLLRDRALTQTLTSHDNEQDDDSPIDDSDDDVDAHSSSESLIILDTEEEDDDDDDSADENRDVNDGLVTRFLHFRRTLPRLTPALPTLISHNGRGTIALTGFNNPQTVDVHCFFHADSRFTLEFLGLIQFQPYRCPCQTVRTSGKCVVGSSEEVVVSALAAASPSPRVPSSSGAHCSRHLLGIR